MRVDENLSRRKALKTGAAAIGLSAGLQTIGRAEAATPQLWVSVNVPTVTDSNYRPKEATSMGTMASSSFDDSSYVMVHEDAVVPETVTFDWNIPNWVPSDHDPSKQYILVKTVANLRSNQNMSDVGDVYFSLSTPSPLNSKIVGFWDANGVLAVEEENTFYDSSAGFKLDGKGGKEFYTVIENTGVGSGVTKFDSMANLNLSVDFNNSNIARNDTTYTARRRYATIGAFDLDNVERLIDQTQTVYSNGIAFAGLITNGVSLYSQADELTNMDKVLLWKDAADAVTDTPLSTSALLNTAVTEGIGAFGTMADQIEDDLLDELGEIHPFGPQMYFTG